MKSTLGKLQSDWCMNCSAVEAHAFTIMDEHLTEACVVAKRPAMSFGGCSECISKVWVCMQEIALLGMAKLRELDCRIHWSFFGIGCSNIYQVSTHYFRSFSESNQWNGRIVQLKERTGSAQWCRCSEKMWSPNENGGCEHTVLKHWWKIMHNCWAQPPTRNLDSKNLEQVVPASCCISSLGQNGHCELHRIKSFVWEMHNLKKTKQGKE